MINYINKIVLSMLAAIVVIGCTTEEELERADYVGFENTTVFETAATGTGSSEFYVYTTTAAGSDRTFTIAVDEEADATTADLSLLTVPTSVVVPANSTVGTFTLETDAANIGTSVVLNLSSSGSTFVGDPITLSIIEECLGNRLTLSLTFDDYPEETAFEIYDADDNLVAGNEDFGDYADMSSASESLCLASGTYTLVLYDSYGDGMFDGTNTGSYAILTSDGVPLVSGDGDFGASSFSVEFVVP